MKYVVTVQRSISVTLSVEAETPDAAIEVVNRNDFELPDRDDWQGHDDWEYRVFGDDGELLAGEA